ncbi:hypothetical protein TREES_T100016718 [Tupaia chinensis]|uniref:Uncharacterized protein n=1 Tax=Tupaia chinensis TaxID=246437 RepID=L9LAE6_TUPCH|nr:hypothetical protein TREES_T100016718 [Tupaia chinensis]
MSYSPLAAAVHLPWMHLDASYPFLLLAQPSRENSESAYNAEAGQKVLYSRGTMSRTKWVWTLGVTNVTSGTFTTNISSQIPALKEICRSVGITCRSRGYHVSVTCRSRGQHVGVKCRSRVRHVGITWGGARAAHVGVPGHVPIMCASRADHVDVTCRSRGHHVGVKCRSRARHVGITWGSRANHVGVTCSSGCLKMVQAHSRKVKLVETGSARSKAFLATSNRFCPFETQ